MADITAHPGHLDPGCPFCAIIAGRDEATILHSWNDCVAFVPLRPATLGHTLIVPTSHFETVWDLDPATGASLAECVLETALILRRVLDISNMNIIQSNGVEATQSVSHVHVHLVPRYLGDNMGDIWPNDGKIENLETMQVAIEVRRSFKA